MLYFTSKVILRQFRNDWNLVWLLYMFGATVIRSADKGIIKSSRINVLQTINAIQVSLHRLRGAKRYHQCSDSIDEGNLGKLPRRGSILR